MDKEKLKNKKRKVSQASPEAQRLKIEKLILRLMESGRIVYFLVVIVQSISVVYTVESYRLTQESEYLDRILLKIFLLLGSTIPFIALGYLARIKKLSLEKQIIANHPFFPEPKKIYVKGFPLDTTIPKDAPIQKQKGNSRPKL